MNQDKKGRTVTKTSNPIQLSAQLIRKKYSGVVIGCKAESSSLELYTNFPIFQFSQAMSSQLVLSINKILNKEATSEYIMHRDMQIDTTDDLLRRYYTLSECKKRRKDTWRFYQFANPKPKIYSQEFAKIYFKYFYLKRKYREEIMMKLLAGMLDSELHRLDLAYLEQYARNKKSILTEIKGKRQSILENINLGLSASNNKLSFGISISKILDNSELFEAGCIELMACDDSLRMSTRAEDVNGIVKPSLKSTKTNYYKNVFKKSLKTNLDGTKPAEKGIARTPATSSITTRKNITNNIKEKLSKMKTDMERVKTNGFELSIKSSLIAKKQIDKPKKSEVKTSAKKIKEPVTLKLITSFRGNIKPAAKEPRARNSVFTSVFTSTRNIDIGTRRHSIALTLNQKETSVRPVKYPIQNIKSTNTKIRTGSIGLISTIQSYRVINTTESLYKPKEKKAQKLTDTSILEEHDCYNTINRKDQIIKARRASAKPSKCFSSMRSMRIIK